MTDVTPELRAAIDLWEHIAAYAWEQHMALGRGVVLVEQEQLLAARDRQKSGEPVQLPLAYVPIEQVPPGDDFLEVISSYDAKRQVVLLVGKPGKAGGEDDEQLYVIEAAEDGRPAPEECFHAQQRASS